MAGANKTAFLFTRVVASASARSDAARPQLIAHSAHARLYLPSPHLQGYVADIDELTTSIVGIDFPKEDKPKRNRSATGAWNACFARLAKRRLPLLTGVSDEDPPIQPNAADLPYLGV